MRLSFVCLLAATPVLTQPNPFSEPARELTRIIEEKSTGGEVLIVPFGLSNSLHSEIVHTAAFKFVETSKAIDFFDQEKFGVRDFAQDVSLAWMGRQLDARIVIGGKTSEKADSFEMNVMIVRASDAHVVASRKYRIRKATELMKQLEASRELPLPRDLKALEYYSHLGDVNKNVAVCGRDGVKLPGCIFCPSPNSVPLEGAHSSKRKETEVILRAIVTSDGLIKEISVLKGAPFGLTQQAIAGMQGWKLAPCQKPDGTPVEGYFVVETNFRWQ